MTSIRDKPDDLDPAQSGTSRYGSSVAVIAAILFLGLLYRAQAVFVPLAFSLLIIALGWPIQKALQRRMPKLLALLITLSLIVLVIVIVGSLVVWGFSLLGQWLIVNSSRFQTIYVDWAQWLEDNGIAVVGPITDRFDVTWLVGFVQGVATRLNSLTGFVALVFIFVMLGLLEVDQFDARLRLPSVQPIGRRIRSANREIGQKLRRFMLVRTAASVLTGLFVWGLALATGLELAAAWGAIAFALNYIPFIGSFIATIFPTLFAIAQFDTLHVAIIVFIGLNIVQFLIGSYLEPRLTGASLAISPFAVVLAVFFWGAMWGLSGAFIGVPMLIAFIVYCGHGSSTRWIAVLLGADSSDFTRHERRRQDGL